MNNDLMQKLVVAKKIMDKHNEVPRGNAINTSTPNHNIHQLQNHNILKYQQETKS